MENQSPFTAEPFATKRSDGKVEVCLTTYKSWLPMFYLLPKEYVQKRSVYLSLPRCPYAIWNTNQYDELVNSDAFLEMIWDSYAWCRIKTESENGCRPISTITPAIFRSGAWRIPS